MIKLKDILLETFSIKSGNELEISNLLQIQHKFVMTGTPFEDFIVKYFEGGYKQTNEGGQNSAFFDVKSGNTYYSVKYSKSVKSGSLNRVVSDNIQTSIAKLISQIVLDQGGSHSEELSAITNVSELEGFMKGKKITGKSFGILAGYAWEEGDNIILRIQYTKTLTGKQIYNKLLAYYKKEKIIKKRPRSALIGQIFDKGTTQDFTFPSGHKSVELAKDTVDDLIIKKPFEKPKDVFRAIKTLAKDVADIVYKQIKALTK